MREGVWMFVIRSMDEQEMKKALNTLKEDEKNAKSRLVELNALIQRTGNEAATYQWEQAIMQASMPSKQIDDDGAGTHGVSAASRDLLETLERSEDLYQEFLSNLYVPRILHMYQKRQECIETHLRCMVIWNAVENVTDERQHEILVRHCISHCGIGTVGANIGISSRTAFRIKDDAIRQATENYNRIAKEYRRNHAEREDKG